MPRLVDERDELRAAIEYLLQSRRLDEAAETLWALLWFWVMGGQLIEASAWGAQILAANQSLSPRSNAIATFYGLALASWQSFEPVRVRRPLARAAKTFRREGDRFGEALVLLTLATARLTKRIPDYIGAVQDARKSYALMEQIGDPFGQNIAGTSLGFLALLRRDFRAARRRFEEVIVRCREIDDRLVEGIAHYHLGWIDVQTGNLEQAKYRFGEQLRVSTDIGAVEGIAFSFEGLFAITAREGDAEAAGHLFGAAEALRERKALFWNRRFAFHTKALEEIRVGPDAARFEEGRSDGRNADLDDVVALAFNMVRGT
jgi:tetratricopeptide (TPR) repeat protein